MNIILNFILSLIIEFHHWVAFSFGKNIAAIFDGAQRWIAKYSWICREWIKWR